MKAVIMEQYGPPEVLQFREIKKPVPPEDQILIGVRSVHINYGDLLARNFGNVTPSKMNMPLLFWFFAKLFFGFGKPKIKLLGSEFAGVVEETGGNVKSFKPGDKVFGYLGQNMGAYAEYLTMKESACVTEMPDGLTFEEASVIPYGSIMALHMLNKIGVKPGMKVLIAGASGSLGSAAVQIAKHLGAEVTGVCGTSGIEFVKALGADHVIDYKKEDFTRSGKSYDIIYDIIRKHSFANCIDSLAPGGVMLFASFKSKELLQMLTTSILKRKDGKRVKCMLAPGGREDLNAAAELVRSGGIKPMVDKIFPAERAAEAHVYAESGNKQGNVVITF